MLLVILMMLTAYLLLLRNAYLLAAYYVLLPMLLPLFQVELFDIFMDAFHATPAANRLSLLYILDALVRVGQRCL